MDTFPHVGSSLYHPTRGKRPWLRAKLSLRRGKGMCLPNPALREEQSRQTSFTFDEEWGRSVTNERRHFPKEVRIHWLLMDFSPMCPVLPLKAHPFPLPPSKQANRN